MATIDEITTAFNATTVTIRKLTQDAAAVEDGAKLAAALTSLDAIHLETFGMMVGQEPDQRERANLTRKLLPAIARCVNEWLDITTSQEFSDELEAGCFQIIRLAGMQADAAAPAEPAPAPESAPATDGQGNAQADDSGAVAAAEGQKIEGEAEAAAGA